MRLDAEAVQEVVEALLPGVVRHVGRRPAAVPAVPGGDQGMAPLLQKEPGRVPGPEAMPSEGIEGDEWGA